MEENSTTPIRTLIVEDNDDDAVLLLNTIRKGGFTPDFLRVDTKDALAAALEQTWDIIFSDYTMPNFNGHDALKIVREDDPDVPFFFVSGTLGEDRAAEAMRLGAQDYFIKGNLKRLPSAIYRELRDSGVRRSHRLAQERIHYLANYDSLTGLPNRTLFIECLAQRVNAAKQSQSFIAVFSLNLNRFKDVNDHLGSAAGDSLLTELGQRLRRMVHAEDTVARFAGDEFAVMCVNLHNDQEAAAMAAKILSVLAQPFSLARYEWRIHGSMGGSLFPRDTQDGGELLRNATIALHHAQQGSSDNFFAYTEKMRAQLDQKVLLHRAMEQALDEKQFALHYQPQVATLDRKIVGVEALLRWQRPGHGPVSPAEFIPMAEESGLIVPIGEWVLRTACAQIKQWREHGLSSLRMAVNFSAYQFRQRNLVETVASVLREFGVPAHCLEVEVTETALMQDTQAAQTILSDLHTLGVSIALDDFGTGYSSLSYLKRFPVDMLKIDRAFISDLPDDEDDAGIVRAIIAMAENLDIQVIAEGVETPDQMAFLTNTSCDLVQGYYVQRPAPADTILKFCSRKNGYGSY